MSEFDVLESKFVFSIWIFLSWLLIRLCCFFYWLIFLYNKKSPYMFDAKLSLSFWIRIKSHTAYQTDCYIFLQNGYPISARIRSQRWHAASGAPEDVLAPDVYFFVYWLDVFVEVRNFQTGWSFNVQNRTMVSLSFSVVVIRLIWYTVVLAGRESFEWLHDRVNDADGLKSMSPGLLDRRQTGEEWNTKGSVPFTAKNTYIMLLRQWTPEASAVAHEIKQSVYRIPVQ